MTLAERTLWTLLRRRQLHGLRFRRQFEIGPFIVDFVCLERRLIVEVDGAVHDHLERIRDDIERDRWLAARRFRILRLTNATVMQEPERALQSIVATLGLEIDDRLSFDLCTTPHPGPPPVEGGGREMHAYDHACAHSAPALAGSADNSRGGT